MGVLQLLHLRKGPAEFESLEQAVKYWISQSKALGRETPNYSIRGNRSLGHSQDGQYLSVILKSVATLTPYDLAFDALKVRAQRYTGFVDMQHLDLSKTASAIASISPTTPEFRDYWIAHTNLLGAEIIMEWLYLISVLTDVPVPAHILKTQESTIASALPAIKRYKGLIPLYDLDHVLGAPLKRASKRPQAPMVSETGIEPHLEILVDPDGKKIQFDSVAKFVNYLSQILPRQELFRPKVNGVESILVDNVSDNRYVFGVEFTANIDIAGQPRIQFKSREPLGVWEFQHPYEYARVSDTIMRARYFELAHTYAKLIMYDLMYQIGKMVGVTLPGLDYEFGLPFRMPTRKSNADNTIAQSLRRNSGLYTPLIHFQNFDVEGHPRNIGRN